MPIDETRLQKALDKIATKRDQAAKDLRIYNRYLESILLIRLQKVEEFDENEVKTGEYLEKPQNKITQKMMSDATRQEGYDEIVPLIEALK